MEFRTVNQNESFALVTKEEADAAPLLHSRCSQTLLQTSSLYALCGDEAIPR